MYCQNNNDIAEIGKVEGSINKFLLKEVFKIYMKSCIFSEKNTEDFKKKIHTNI